MDPKLTQTISQILTPLGTDPTKNTNAAFVIFDLFLYHVEAINIEDPSIERLAINIEDPSIERFIDAMLAKAIEGQQKSIRKHAFDKYVNEFSNLLDRIRKARELEKHVQGKEATDESVKLKLKLAIDKLQKNMPNAYGHTAYGSGFWQRIRKQVDTEELGSSKISRLQRELQRML